MRVLAPPVTCASLGRGTRVTNATQKPIASWRVFDANRRPGYRASAAAVAGSFGFSVRGRRDGSPNVAVGSVTARAASSRDVDPPRGIVGDNGNRVALNGEVSGICRIIGNRGAHSGNSGGVGASEIGAITHGNFDAHLNFAAKVDKEH